MGGGTAGDIWMLDIPRNVTAGFTFNRQPGRVPGLVARGRPHTLYRRDVDLLLKKRERRWRLREPLKIRWAEGPDELVSRWAVPLNTQTAPKSGEDILILPLEGERKPITRPGHSLQRKRGRICPRMGDRSRL